MRKSLLLFLLFFITVHISISQSQSSKEGLIAHWTFNEGSGKILKDEASGAQDSIHYVFNNARFKPSSDPLWRANGIVRGTLLFDGYSTWIKRDSENFNTPTDAITISVWVAPRTFEQGIENKLSAIVNQQNKAAKEGFILGMFRHGTWTFQFGSGQTWVELWDQGHPLKKNQWSYLVATYDKNTSRVLLYLNGNKIAEKVLDQNVSNLPIQKSEEDLLIGKNNQSVKLAGVFDLNMFNGLMDELNIYNHALTAEEVEATYKQYLEKHHNQIPEIAYEDIRLDPDKFQGDRHRPQYHAMPPGHWMNEPHAPFYYNGKYHLFYQQNPTGPYWHHIQWGHWVSNDMVHWKQLPIALSPEDDNLAPDGIWSGSATYDENGVPVLFFTAGNKQESPDQSVAIARPKDPNDPNLIEWVKHPEPVTRQVKGIGLTKDFRDPFVWKDEKEDKWYQLTSSSIEGKRGTALFFESDNLIDWAYKGELYKYDENKYPFLGPIWELPVLLPIGQYPSGEKRYIFLISPVGKGADVEVFYWLGKFDKSKYRFIPDQEDPQLIDLGDFHFTGPSGMVDPKTGRVIVFTIAQGERTSQDEYDAGWAHNAGLPVNLSLDDKGKLLVKPIEELKSLRDEKLISFENKGLEEVNQLLKDIQGDLLEIQVEIKANDADSYGIKLRRSPEGEEETLIYYDSNQQKLLADRTKTSKAKDYGITGGQLDIPDQNLKLHIYLDRSMVEVYANERKSLTTRAYPELHNSLGIQVWADGEVEIKSMEVWRLNAID